MRRKDREGEGCDSWWQAGKHLAKFASFVPKFPHFSHEDGSGGDVDDDNEGRRREGPLSLSVSGLGGPHA